MLTGGPRPARTQPRPRGYQGYSATHPRTEEAAGAARRLARAACTAWALPDDLTESVALVASELVSNAVRHARGPSLRVIVDRPGPNRVYVAVVDRAPGRLPQLRAPGPEQECGRGLLLVKALSESWGCDQLGPTGRPWGKRCWSELTAAR